MNRVDVVDLVVDLVDVDLDIDLVDVDLDADLVDVGLVDVVLAAFSVFRKCVFRKIPINRTFSLFRRV